MKNPDPFSPRIDLSREKVDLVGGYYDAGDNVKFNFPMAFSATILAWGVLEYGSMMGRAELSHARDAVVWAVDYLMKASSIPGVVYAVVGDPISDHDCWERPEDMDTSRAAYAINRTSPGSDLAAEVAAALAAASLLLKDTRPGYAINLTKRAVSLFKFAAFHRGVYSDSVTQACPFYCSSGYEDELVWAAAWLYKATKIPIYWNFVQNNIKSAGGPFDDFGWDWKTAGIKVLVSQTVMTERKSNRALFIPDADRFVCSALPQSPTRSGATWYSRGGLLFRNGPSNMQHSTTISFLVLTYARYLIKYDSNRVIQCGNLLVNPKMLIQLAKSQVDYILGDNPMKMSYMAGYGSRFPQRIHHRASTLPSVAQHPKRFACQEGSSFFKTTKANPNVLVGAIVGGPDANDRYTDSRINVSQAEPTTYITAPMVGLLAYFNSRPT